MKAQPGNEIKKLHLHETVKFATRSIPQTDPKTLETLLALVNVDGTHGTISQTQLLAKMRQMLRYVPETCVQSLLILADLLELPTSDPRAALQSPDEELVMPGISVAQLLKIPVFDEVYG